eukprot:1919647-Rhodomonas_salina.2
MARQGLTPYLHSRVPLLASRPRNQARPVPCPQLKTQRSPTALVRMVPEVLLRACEMQNKRIAGTHCTKIHRDS